VGGVADYTAILSRRLVEVSDGAVKPVLVHTGRQSAEKVDIEFPVEDLSGQCSASALAQTIDRLASEADGPTVVLLEYSGYGYAKRGAPVWLARGVQRVCGPSALPLITMFHELYATGAPWTSAFWMSIVQRYVASQLAQRSRAVVSNRSLSAEWLRTKVDINTSVYTQPVFSNVGEPERIPHFEDRESYAVVFGGRTMKRRLYESLRNNHAAILKDLGVNRVLDLGPSDGSPDAVAGVPIDAHGIQPASVISEHLQQAKLGLLRYPVDYLTKSGIWASYAAHGLPTLIFSDASKSVPFEEGTPFLHVDPNGSRSKASGLAEIGRRAWEWYQTHTHSKEAARLFATLVNSRPVVQAS